MEDLHVEEHVAVRVGEVVAHALVVVGHDAQAPRLEDLAELLDGLLALGAGQALGLEDRSGGLALVERLARAGGGEAPSRRRRRRQRGSGGGWPEGQA